MRVLVACEYSGTVRDAFLKRGHDAMSCDLLETEVPGPHYKGDVRDVLGDGWDLLIGHPDCTYLTISAEWAYADTPMINGKPRKMKEGTLFGEARRKARDEAVEFFRLLWEAPIKKIALENPVGVISSRICKPSQTIQPYEYGHDASKKTCLWLKNLPVLEPTKYVEPRWVHTPKGVMARWANQTDGGQNKLAPSPDRWKERARTYTGWARAMAAQWGGHAGAEKDVK